MEHRVLIIGDGDKKREELSGLTSVFGMPSDCCSWSDLAVKRARSFRYSTVVVDIECESLSPEDCIALAKAAAPYTPIVVVTGESSLDAQRAVRQMGIFYYLVRPIQKEEFIEVLGDAVEFAGSLGAKDAVVSEILSSVGKNDWR
jgi:DNA-binding NtrC family response regulator